MFKWGWGAGAGRAWRGCRSPGAPVLLPSGHMAMSPAAVPHSLGPRDYMEEYNTATLPHRKYYDLGALSFCMCFFLWGFRGRICRWSSWQTARCGVCVCGGGGGQHRPACYPRSRVPAPALPPTPSPAFPPDQQSYTNASAQPRRRARASKQRRQAGGAASASRSTTRQSGDASWQWSAHDSSRSA